MRESPQGGHTATVGSSPSLQDISAAPVVWSPQPADVDGANVTGFMSWLHSQGGPKFHDYDELWHWSVTELEAFWGAVWDFYDIRSTARYDVVLESRAMPGARWFPGARLNYVDHVLRAGEPDEVAVVALEEDLPPVEISWGRLRGQVGAMAAALSELGVGPGDRVAGYLPNIPAAVVAMLATASLGAVWTSCAPDFGARSVLDRLGQTEPTVLVAADGYRHNGQEHDRRDTVAELLAGLPTVCRAILVRALHPEDPAPAGMGDPLLYDEVVAEPREPAPVEVEFDHPLWILFSSGTTGKPKGIVQSHGGILVEHYKTLGLCLDLGARDTYFFHSSTSWMAWNFLVGGLLHRSKIVLYSGSPSHGGTDGLWRLAADVGATVLGMGAAYANACAKAGVTLEGLDLSALRVVIPTGSPLPLGGWRWLGEVLDERVRIDAICGGTDVCTAFFGGSPLLPVRLGQISGRYLGVDAHAFDDEGRKLVGEVGEFVVTTPMPSMPVRFLHDPQGSRLRDAYFARYPGVWAQGDWIIVTDQGGVLVLGRSDATLNRGGVRLGSADLYTLVEAHPEIADSLVVGAELPDGEYYMPLFVVPAPGHEVDDAVRQRLVDAIRSELSPRHVPDDIVTVEGLPRTLTGKKLEVPVKLVLQGRPAESAVAMGAIDRPELFAWFEDFAAQREGTR